MTRPRALVFALLLAALAGGCNIETRSATDVTGHAATLRAKLTCGGRDHGRAHGRLWWQLREEAGRWKPVSRKRRFACRKGRKHLRLSKRVTGLRPGTSYRFRVAVDPNRRGGRVFHSAVRRFATPGPGPAPKPFVPATIRGFSPGLVGSADHGLSAIAARRLGAKLVRLEFDVGAPAAALRPSVDALARQGAEALLLAGFHGRMPTEDEARNLGDWAAEFGPGGRFWQGRSDGQLAVRQIEFGNETSYAHQYGDNWSSPSYRERAKLYATRLAQAHAAIAASGGRVGLLAQADDGGTGSSNWVDGMFDAVPHLGQIVDGWTVHPYGPQGTWKPKLDRLIAQTGANGAPSTIPIDVTEYGISSNDGVPLTDNYGWPVNQTFAQAAAALDATVTAMRADPAIGPRLRLFMLYAAHDLGGSLGPNNRERFFGALTLGLGDKGAYTAEVRELYR